jgi:hypothetical protein
LQTEWVHISSLLDNADGSGRTLLDNADGTGRTLLDNADGTGRTLLDNAGAYYPEHIILNN